MAKEYQGDWLRVGGVKIIGDGSTDACTAALSKPYTNGSSSDPIWTPEALDAVVEAADAAGLQIAVHAVGDQAIQNTVDATEKAMQVNGTSGRRHRPVNLCAARGGELRAIAHGCARAANARGRAGAAKHTDVRERPMRLESDTSSHERPLLDSSSDAAKSTRSRAACAVHSRISTLGASLKLASRRPPEHFV